MIVIERIINHLKTEKKSMSFREIQRKFDLQENQLDLIILQLLQLGYIEEESSVSEDELNPVLCRDCPHLYKCSEKDPSSIKVYRLTEKINF